MTVLVIVALFAVIGAGHHDASNEYTSIEDTVAATKMVRERGLVAGPILDTVDDVSA